jgi:hypothetical protein
MGVSDGVDKGSNGSVVRGQLVSKYSNVAGFVYLNRGSGAVSGLTPATVEDCYVNIVTRQTVNGHSGFAYFNKDNATIKNCIVNSPLTNNSNGYRAFLSTDIDSGATHGNLVNNIFKDPGYTIDGYYRSDELRRVVNDEFGEIGKFYAFSMSEKDDANQINIWRMTELGPRLVSADDIAVSLRVQSLVDLSGQPILSYHDEFAYGSKINPVIIATGVQFNDEIYQESGALGRYSDSVNLGIPIDYEKNNYIGHIRLVNNISYDKAEIIENMASNLKSTFLSQTIFLSGILDGNGFNISNISLNVGDLDDLGDLKDESKINSIGIFSKVKDAVIKNVKLSFSRYGNNAYSIQGVKKIYTGGLAGTVINSKISDIMVSGDTNNNDNYVDFRGGNITGGLAGLVQDSLIMNVYGHVTVESSKGSGLGITVDFYNNAGTGIEDYANNAVTEISVAGGLIGFATGETVIKNIGNYSDKDFNVIGEVVGGIIGFADKSVSMKAVVYNNSAAYLNGKYYAGGLVGVNCGEIDNESVIGVSIYGNIDIDSTSFIVSYPDVNNVEYKLGMVVGGVAGYNSGTIKNVKVGSSNNNLRIDNVSIWVLGGVVGDNIGGTVKNCDASSTSLRGGFYIGGIAGYDNKKGVDLASVACNNTTLSSIRSSINSIFENGYFPHTNSYVGIWCGNQV